jgi:hypothetical protein
MPHLVLCCADHFWGSPEARRSCKPETDSSSTMIEHQKHQETECCTPVGSLGAAISSITLCNRSGLWKLTFCPQTHIQPPTHNQVHTQVHSAAADPLPHWSFSVLPVPLPSLIALLYACLSHPYASDRAGGAHGHNSSSRAVGNLCAACLCDELLVLGVCIGHR